MTAESPDALRICIALPFYADLGYLQVALRSLLDQTDRRWTAIVVDDASPETGADALVAALGDSRVRYVRNERNLGVAGNFNRCLELGSAVADIVTVFHADDVLGTGYVAAIRAAHERCPLAVCVAPRVNVIDADGAKRRTVGDTVKRLMWPRRLPATLVGDPGLARLMQGLFFYCPSVSYRVALLPEVRFDARWQQVMDLDLYARVLLDGGSIVLVADPVYSYRRHEATMTAQNTRSRVRLAEEVAVSREVASAAQSNGWRRARRAARLRSTVRLNGMFEAVKLLVRGRLGDAGSVLRLTFSR